MAGDYGILDKGGGGAAMGLQRGQGQRCRNLKAILGAGFHFHANWDHQRMGCVENGMGERAQK